MDTSETAQLTAVIYGTLPYKSHTLEVKFPYTETNRFVFMDAIRNLWPSKDIQRHAMVFLTSPPIDRKDHQQAEKLLKHCIEHLVSVCKEGFLSGKMHVDVDQGNIELNYCAWFAGKSLANLSERLEDLGKGSGVNCFIIPTEVLRKRPIEEDGIQPLAKKVRFGESDSEDEEEDDGDGWDDLFKSGVLDGDARRRIRKTVAKFLSNMTPLQLDRLRDPRETTSVTFPSLHSCGERLPPDTVRGDDSVVFQFRGRNALVTDIIPTLQRMYAQRGFAEYHLYGTHGSGVDFTVTTAAAYLLSTGIPVVYITCQSFGVQTYWIRDAILLALSAKKELIEQWGISLFPNRVLSDSDEMKGLIKLCNRLANEGSRLVFVMSNIDEAKKEDYDQFMRMAQGHVLCFTASPNSQLCARDEWGYDAKDKKVLHLNSLSEDEFHGWLCQYEAETSIKFSTEDQELIFASTGGNPCLLQHWYFRTKENGRFSPEDLRCPSNVLGMMDYHLRHPSYFPDAQEENMGKAILAAALSNDIQPECGRSSKIIDRRFIFRDGHRWTCSGLYVLHALWEKSLYTPDFLQHTNVHVWRKTLPKYASNRYLLGFGVKYSLTNAISKFGVHFRISRHLTFKFPPRALKTIRNCREPDAYSSGLYVPVDFDKRYVDLVAVWLNKYTKSVYICPIHISLAKKVDVDGTGRNARERFFEGDWKKWELNFSSTIRKGWTVSWRFLWILDCDSDSEEKGRKVYVQPKEGVDLYPTHEEWVTDVASISGEVGDALRLATKGDDVMSVSECD
ncbi:hypothetical protein VKT23_011028 [Stygiomarasmius scandens]|uniref:Uncharacterized protein n=1 Tax=Marasmiellus scandens TaxID=2682957 RepID=A0ABR1JAM4_9AGAR